MRYKEFGKEHSAVMVFIHGGGVGGWMWDAQVDYFATKYHCIVVDMVDYAHIDTNTRFTIDGAAEDIIALIEAVGKNKKTIVVGFSLGAQVLVAMLAKKPNLIDFAMVNSALVKPLPFARTLIGSMSYMLPLVKKRYFSDLQAKSLYIPDAYLNIYYQENLQMNKAIFTDIMAENMSFRIPDDLAKATAKILVTVGQKERKVMKDSAKNIVALSSKAELRIIPGIGHGFPLANPVLFNTTLEKWIE